MLCLQVVWWTKWVRRWPIKPHKGINFPHSKPKPTITLIDNNTWIYFINHPYASFFIKIQYQLDKHSSQANTNSYNIWWTLLDHSSLVKSCGPINFSSRYPPIWQAFFSDNLGKFWGIVPDYFQSQISESIVNRVGDINDDRSIDELLSGAKFFEEMSDFTSVIRKTFRTVLLIDTWWCLVCSMMMSNASSPESGSKIWAAALANIIRILGWTPS